VLNICCIAIYYVYLILMKQALRKDNGRMATEIEELTAQLADLTQLLTSMTSQPDSSSGDKGGEIKKSADGNASSSKYDHNWVTPGDESYCQEVSGTVMNLHNKLNVLSVQIHPTLSNIVASGGVDNKVRITNCSHVDDKGVVVPSGASSSASAESMVIQCKAPPLTLDWRPDGGGLLAIGCMDGSVALAFVDLENSKSHLLVNLSPHNRYVTACKWSPDGQYLASSSVDKVLKLFTCIGAQQDIVNHYLSSDNKDDDSAAAAAEGACLKCVQTWYREECVEALCFMNHHLIFSERNHHSLLYVNLEPKNKSNDNSSSSSLKLDISEVPINNNDFDRHVSFTILNLVPSPDAKFLLASTDKDRHIIYPMKSNRHVRVLFGHSSDSFAKPRACWDPTGKVSGFLLSLISTHCCHLPQSTLSTSTTHLFSLSLPPPATPCCCSSSLFFSFTTFIHILHICVRYI
jgi:WD40 repeat protein